MVAKVRTLTKICQSTHTHTHPGAHMQNLNMYKFLLFVQQPSEALSCHGHRQVKIAKEPLHTLIASEGLTFRFHFESKQNKPRLQHYRRLNYANIVLKIFR